MNKKLVLSVLSTAVLTSMAASAMAAPSGYYVGGNVDKIYSTDFLIKNFKEASKDIMKNPSKTVFVDEDGKAVNFMEAMLSDKNYKELLKPATKSMFEDNEYVNVATGEKWDPKKEEWPEVPGDLTVESVSAITKTTVKIQFNKSVDSVSKENFSIAGATVNAAVLSEDKKSVTLDVSGMAYETEYTVVASNVLVDGKPVTLEGKKFKTPAVTDVYNLELTTDAPNDEIRANGADNMVITAKLKDKITGEVDTNADNIVVSFSSTYGSLANNRVVVQDGVATVTLTSEFSQKDLVSKIDAQIIEASGDYKDLIGKVVGTKNVYFKLKIGDNPSDNKPVFENAESNQADRITMYFNKDVTVADFVKFDETTQKFVVDDEGNAVLVEGVKVLVYQDKDNDGKPIAKKVRGFKPVEGNSKALELVLDKKEQVGETYVNILEDNKPVFVEFTQPSSNGEKKTQDDFILTDAREPEATSAIAQGLKTVVVKFSEPVIYSGVQLDGGLTKIEEPVEYGEFNQETLEDTRDLITITTQDFMSAGVHSVQLYGIKDFAGLSDKKNISTNQTLDFKVEADPSVPTATVTVESPEQYRVTFNKKVTGLDAASKVTLQKLVKGTGGAADEWKPVDELVWDGETPTLSIDPVYDTAKDAAAGLASQFVVELNQDWTKIYDTSKTKKNYYNDQYRLVIAKETVTNPANGKKNADITLPLNYSGSKMNYADTSSPEISGFEVVRELDSIKHFIVSMSEPVKLPIPDSNKSHDNAGNTPSQIQGDTVPMPIIEFLGKDKDGNALTIKGKVEGYAGKDKSDNKVIVNVDDDQPKLEQIVKDGGDKNWTLVVRSISDDVGNTAASLTYDFKVEVKQAQEVFMVKGKLPNGDVYNNNDKAYGYLNGSDADYIILDFTSDVQVTGTTKNAVNPSNYLLDGKKLPDDTVITASDSDDVGTLPDIVTIKLPNGTLSSTASHVITLGKSLESVNGVKLSGEYEISFKAVGKGSGLAATEVVALIDNLPALSKLTLADEADVTKALTEYDKLSTEEQKLVSNYHVLKAAKEKIDQLKQGQVDAEKALKEAIAAVDTLEQAANTAKDNPTEDTVTAAEDALKTAKAKVLLVADANEKKLLDAKVTLAEQTVKEARAAYDKQAAEDLKAAQAVDTKIEALPAVDKLTVDDEAAVKAARDAYNALTGAQQKLVKKLDVLTAAENKIAELKGNAAEDLKAAQAVDTKIAELPAVADLKLTDEDAVKAARAAYEALTDAQKALVTKLEDLKAAEDKIAELKGNAADVEAAKAVDTKIAELPAVADLKLTDEDAVKAARAAYEALTDAQKALVTKLEDLKAAEAKIAQLKADAADAAAAQAVDTKIAELPAVADLKLTDEDAVKKAAEDKIAELKGNAADVEAAKAVDTKIAELPAVADLKLTDEDAVKAARAAYEALTDAKNCLWANCTRFSTWPF
ncbi:sugar-binding domain protein [Brevibacillus borstelensis]|uniref:sugar-binding domain protein n=1 Tax=Brevibacillus borstelensis TaxID=45462 RepID=UPI0030F929C1